MGKTFLFELVSPEKLLFSEQVKEVILPGSEGYLTVLPQHAPLMTKIMPGIVTVQTAEKKHSFVVYGGFADITAEHCSLLAESAVPKENFNAQDIASRIEAVRKEMSGEDSDEHRNKMEDFLHQLTTVAGVLTEA